jgi:hypothetical protein
VPPMSTATVYMPEPFADAVEAPFQYF